MSVTIEDRAGATPIRPFTIPKVPEAELQALRARITATRRPDQETVPDDSQGEPLALIEELARYSAADYDWRCEAKLDTLPQAPPLCGAAGRRQRPRSAWRGPPGRTPSRNCRTPSDQHSSPARRPD